MPLRTAVVEAVTDAIRGRFAARLVYARDSGGGPRVVHPHVLYVGATGRLLLDAYQVGGHSSSGGLPAWRMFDVEALTDVEVLAERFGPAPGYDRSDASRFVEVLAEAVFIGGPAG